MHACSAFISISTTFITPPNYYMWVHVIAFLVLSLVKAVRKLSCFKVSQKSTSRQRSGNGAIRKRLPLQKPRWEKTKLTIRYLYHENIS